MKTKSSHEELFVCVAIKIDTETLPIIWLWVI